MVNARRAITITPPNNNMYSAAPCPDSSLINFFIVFIFITIFPWLLESIFQLASIESFFLFLEFIARHFESFFQFARIAYLRSS